MAVYHLYKNQLSCLLKEPVTGLQYPVMQHKLPGGQQMLQLFSNCFLKLLPCWHGPVSIQAALDQDLLFVGFLTVLAVVSECFLPKYIYFCNYFVRGGSFTDSLFQWQNGDSFFNTTGFVSASFLELLSLPSLAYLPSTTSAVVSDKNLC